MPIYEYDCPVCGRFEVIQKFSDKELSDCPDCKAKGTKSAVKRALSVSAFHLKGGGWYKTDYGSSGSGSSGSTNNKSTTSSSESPDTKASASKEGSGSGASDTPKPGCGTTCGCD
jgi:putative FmdB family regulatory protein